MRKIINCLIIMGFILLLISCNVPSIKQTLPDTVVDPFVQPDVPETNNNANDRHETNIEKDTVSPIIGSLTHGFKDKSLTNEYGLRHIYSGEEMHINYSIAMSGNISDAGVGIMLFLDGKPQPYKILDDNTYKYMHTFSGATRVEPELIFVPVTGQKGDSLELFAITFVKPDYFPGDIMAGNVQSNSALATRTQLEFEESPPEYKYPETPERLITYSIQYEDISSKISNTQTSKSIYYNLSVNGQSESSQVINPCVIYNMTKLQSLNCEFEMYGSTEPEYCLIFFVNHEPISILSEKEIIIRNKNGQKLTVEAIINMSDFDGEAIVYAVVATRNSRFVSDDISGNIWADATSTFYISSSPTYEEMIENHRNK